MAHIETSGSGRKTNLEVNLVPFIDLMSVLITFLLISAVWTQVSMIQMGSSIAGKKTEEKMAPLPPQSDVVLKVEIRKTGYTVTVQKQVTQIPTLSTGFDDAKLIELLNNVKVKFPEKTNGALAMADELPYENLIKGMDALLKAGFSNIEILTGGPY